MRPRSVRGSTRSADRRRRRAAARRPGVRRSAGHRRPEQVVRAVRHVVRVRRGPPARRGCSGRSARAARTARAAAASACAQARGARLDARQELGAEHHRVELEARRQADRQARSTRPAGRAPAGRSRSAAACPGCSGRRGRRRGRRRAGGSATRRSARRLAALEVLDAALHRAVERERSTEQRPNRSDDASSQCMHRPPVAAGWIPRRGYPECGHAARIRLPGLLLTTRSGARLHGSGDAVRVGELLDQHEAAELQALRQQRDLDASDPPS